MDITTLYRIVFILYSLLVVGIGFYIYYARRQSADTGTEAYWAAERGLSGLSAGLSISASMMSISWSCVYGVQLFYWYGAGAAWLLIIPWLITMSGFFLLARRFRKLEAFSQPELIARRFGEKYRQLLTPALVFVFIVWGGAEIYAAGITIAPFLGLPVNGTIFLIALVVALYSYTGGFEAVISTDKIQFALVAGFISIMAIVGVTAAGPHGGISAMIAANSLAPKATAAPWYLSPGVALVFMTMLAYLPGWLVETDVWIRLQAASSDAEARKAILVASLNSLLFVGIAPLLIGLSALVLFAPVDGIIPAQLADGALIFSVMMQNYTPGWLNVLLGIGLVAAAMSTVDTCGNIVALSLSYDLVEPRLKHRLSAAQLQQLARWMSVAAIGFAYLYALFTDSLWDIFYLSSGILTTTIFLPVIAAVLGRGTVRQTIGAAVFGFAGTLIFYYLESRGHMAAFEPDWLAETQVGYILIGFGFSFLGFFAGRIPR